MICCHGHHAWGDLMSSKECPRGNQPTNPSNQATRLITLFDVLLRRAMFSVVSGCLFAFWLSSVCQIPQKECLRSNMINAEGGDQSRTNPTKPAELSDSQNQAQIDEDRAKATKPTDNTYQSVAGRCPLIIYSCCHRYVSLLFGTSLCSRSCCLMFDFLCSA